MTTGTPAVLAVAQPMSASTQRQQTDDQFRINGGDLTNVGTGSLSTSVAARRGGAVLTVPGRTSGSTAMGFPAFDAAKKGERAVVVVRNSTGSDDLNPGKRPFTFGADFLLDAGATTSTAASSGDRGDNVIQRGLFDNDTQYKIEADGGRVDCRIGGRSGSVFAKVSPPRIKRNAWYHVECTRDGNRVTLSLSGLSSGTEKMKTAHGSGPTGSMTPASPSVPLTIGGKIGASGNVSINSSDQFNGKIANAFLRISPPKARTQLSAKVNESHPRTGQKVRFSGTLQPNIRHARVSLAFRAKGTHGYAALRHTKVSSQSKFRFKKVRVGPNGKYRISYAGNSHYKASKIVIRYRHNKFTF